MAGKIRAYRRVHLRALELVRKKALISAKNARKRKAKREARLRQQSVS